MTEYRIQIYYYTYLINPRLLSNGDKYVLTSYFSWGMRWNCSLIFKWTMNSANSLFSVNATTLENPLKMTHFLTSYLVRFGRFKVGFWGANWRFNRFGVRFLESKPSFLKWAMWWENSTKIWAVNSLPNPAFKNKNKMYK